MSRRMIPSMRRTAALVAILSLFARAASAQTAPGVYVADRAPPSLARREWPIAQRLRGLPVCAPMTPFPPPDAPFPCRRALRSAGPELSLGLGAGAGLIASDSVTTGSALQLDAQADLFVTPAFGFGARYRFLNAQTDGDRDTLELHPLSAGLRIRIFQDDVDRTSWTLEPEGGYAFTTGGRADGGPFVSLSVVRSVGAFVTEGTSLNLALAATVLQGVGSLSDVRAFTLGLRVGPSFNAHAPRDVATSARPASFHYTLGLRWYMLGLAFGRMDAVAASPGGALQFGVPVVRWFEPFAQVDMAYWSRGPKNDDPAPLTFSLMGGVRVRMNGLAPLYVSALAGYQVAAGRSPRGFGDGAVMDLGFGLNITTCGGSFQFGAHYRRGLSHEADDFNALMLVMGITFGSLTGSVGEAPLDHSATGRCVSSPSRGSTQYVQQPVQVVATPVEVSVVVGVALFGGLVQFHLNPDVLPLERLVRAGAVSVRLEGPAQVLPQAEAELHAALDARGVTVRQSSTVAIGGASEVRAVFTIWPPGAGPQ